MIKWRGFTLIELLATMTIIGILTILAVPAFESLQEREQFTTVQRAIQSKIYEMQSLALAPPTNSAENYTIVGYGLIFTPRKTSEIIGCKIKSDAAVLSTIEFVKYSDGDLRAYLKGGPTPIDTAAAPTSGADCGSGLYPQAKANDFFVIPEGIDLSSTTSTTGSTLPWVIAQPLVVADYTSKELITDLQRDYGDGYTDPLSASGSTAKLFINALSGRTSTGTASQGVCFSHESAATITSGSCS